ncbi:MAG: hypothetical protein AB1651_19020 [Pseudomonadota bacterium]
MKRKYLRLAAVAPLALLLVALGLQCPPARAGNMSWIFEQDVMSACRDHPAISHAAPNGREHHAMLHECEARILSDPRVVPAREHATAAWALSITANAVMTSREGAWANLSDSRSSDIWAVREADKAFWRIAEYINDWLSAARAYEAHLPASILAEKRRVEEETARNDEKLKPMMDGHESFLAEHKAEMASFHAEIAAAVPGYAKMRAENAALDTAIAAQRGNASQTLKAAIAVSVSSLTERQLLDGAKKRFPAVDRCLEQGRPFECLTDLEQQVFRDADPGARHAPD